MPKNAKMELVEGDACPRRNVLGVGRIPEPQKKGSPGCLGYTRDYTIRLSIGIIS